MIGTIITALISSFITAFFAYSFTQYLNFEDKNAERIAILTALQSELSSLLYLIHSREDDFKTYDPSDLPKGSLPYIPITLNYFSVFESLSAKFGLITNSALVSEIIRTYMETKGLFENVKDLEYFAKQSHALIITPPQKFELLDILISFHNGYRESLLEIQIPLVETLIQTCINDINKEKESISLKNTFLEYFLKF
ncbi:MAG: hypothetical protein SPI35_07890 [Porphyromonas sp.]|nr:hypothetical protein [Porphyromonas sp.]